MDKIYDLLLAIHNEADVTQRLLAKQVNLSLGTTNTLLNYLAEHKFITIEKEKRQYHYQLTNLGEEKLKNLLTQVKETKLQIVAKKRKITTAVILAAGKGRDFSQVPALLPLEKGATTPIQRSLKLLRDRGITKTYIVVGYEKEKLQETLAAPDIEFLENPDYEFTGTMASLSKVFPQLTEDFLLVEGDLVYEEHLLDQLLLSEAFNGISCVSLSGSSDEAFVDLDEAGNILRISKDIRQMNRIYCEMMGMVKVSKELLQEMKDLYEKNNNPWLNYEYLLLQAAETYEVKGVLTTNGAWGDIDDKKAYEKMLNLTYPSIMRHENQRQLAYGKEKLQEILNLEAEEISNFHFAGGMTNNNYAATIQGKEYFIRIPGKCTEEMINRDSEALNAQIASALGLNVDTLYINPKTGIKVAEAVPHAETLSPKSAKIPSTMVEVAEKLKSLHEAEITFPNTFSFKKEWEKYELLVKKVQGEFYPDYEAGKKVIIDLYDYIKTTYGFQVKPCHNDLVAENFVRNGKNHDLFLIDWEYSGMNDPAWDLAAFIIENELSKEEMVFFLKAYEKNTPSPAMMEKVQAFTAFQDMLWSVWTIAKESAGVDFGSYGVDRFLRGVKTGKEILAHGKKA